jgi:hypothetical protein
MGSIVPPLRMGSFSIQIATRCPSAARPRSKAVRLRHGFVVSVSENGLVLPDGESTLLVATGAARNRLGGLRPGDRVTVSYTLDPAPLFLREAISAAHCY